MRKPLTLNTLNPKYPEPLNPRNNALNPWHAVKPAYAYACLSIAVKKICPMFVQCMRGNVTRLCETWQIVLNNLRLLILASKRSNSLNL